MHTLRFAKTHVSLEAQLIHILSIQNIVCFKIIKKMLKTESRMFSFLMHICKRNVISDTVFFFFFFFFFSHLKASSTFSCITTFKIMLAKAF